MEKIQVPTFVKWAGGKTQLLPKYEPFFPKSINRYFEPFVGSGAVFFYVKQKYNPEYSMISDVNQDLINTYKIIKNDVDDLLEILKNHKKNHAQNPKTYFYKMRTKFNSTKNKLEKTALLIYLNKTCFNGLYRVNSKGDFNVPFGKYKNPPIVQESKLKKASKLLHNVDIKKMKFERIKSHIKNGDFIYFDPPYYPLSKTSSFTSYQKDTFLDREQKKLWKIFKLLDEKNCKIMLSNSDHEFIRSLYNSYDIKVIKANRMISCNGAGRGPINELLIRNYKTKFFIQSNSISQWFLF